MGIRAIFRRSGSKEPASRVDKEEEEEDEPKYDKQWARKYLLDPLTAPEPSQETGLGTSHVHPYITAARERLEAEAAAAAVSEAKSKGKNKNDDIRHSYPTPPSSASPTAHSFDFSPSEPFATSYNSFHLGQSTRPCFESTSPSALAPSVVTPHTCPSHRISTGNINSNTGYVNYYNRHTRSVSESPASPPRRHQRQVSLPVDTVNTSSTAWGREFCPEYPGNQLEKARQICQNAKNLTDPNNKPRPKSLVRERFPGDMSHRPLDMIKREARAADRPHRHRKRISETDTIDALDTIGGAYHHGGPYDATLRSRNLDKKYSPVAAVEESNMEAIRATPRENIMDSLLKHVPLQGTASIPSGAPDMRGQIMRYEEGADLMREPDAEGGAYKRWDGIQYHPDDLKGKGEPSFTLERDLKKKEKRHRYHLSEADAFEMRPGANRFSKQAGTHQRSVSQHGEGSSSGFIYKDNADGDLRRAHSTGKKLSEGLKRRFGSIRRKKDMPSEAIA